MSETYHQDYDAAVAWAREMLERSALILDTETTGLDDHAEICQIAIISSAGHTILNSLVRPTKPIPEVATNIHGITNEMVADAPTWYMLWPVVREIIQRRTIVIYNADYDMRLIAQSLRAVNVHAPGYIDTAECAMLKYAAYVGDWNDYRGDYRWQKLPSGDHSALGDCQATLKILKQMAKVVDKGNTHEP